MTKATKKILVRYIIAPILMVIFLWLIYLQLIQKGDLSAQWTDLKKYWTQAPWYGTLLVLLLAPLNWFWEACKWQIAMKKVYAVSLWTSFKAILTGIAFAMVTPGKIGDFAGRILYVPNSRKLQATLATLMTNMIQVIATSLLGLIGLVYFMLHYSNDWLRDLLLYVGLFILGVLIIWWSARFWWHLVTASVYYQKIRKSFRIFKHYNRRILFKIFGLSLLRFLTYNIQFLVLANLLGSQTPWTMGLFTTMLMFWLITLIPSLIVSDIGVRGFLASMLFLDTGLTTNGVSLLSASYMIWLLNLISPAIIGSLLLLSIRHSKLQHDSPRNKGLHR